MKDVEEMITDLPKSRSNRIMAAIEMEMRRYESEVDDDEFLRSISFTVKLHSGSGHVRAVIVNRESERSHAR